MPEFLGVDLADELDRELSPLVKDITFRQVSEGTFNVAAGTYTGASTTDHAGRGFEDKVSDFMRATLGLEAADRKFVAMQDSFPTSMPRPEPHWRVVFETQVFVVTNVSEDPASATWEIMARLVED